MPVGYDPYPGKPDPFEPGISPEEYQRRYVERYGKAPGVTAIGWDAELYALNAEILKGMFALGDPRCTGGDGVPTELECRDASHTIPRGSGEVCTYHFDRIDPHVRPEGAQPWMDPETGSSFHPAHAPRALSQARMPIFGCMRWWRNGERPADDPPPPPPPPAEDDEDDEDVAIELLEAEVTRLTQELDISRSEVALARREIDLVRKQLAFAQYTPPAFVEAVDQAARLLAHRPHVARRVLRVAAWMKRR